MRFTLDCFDRRFPAPGQPKNALRKPIQRINFNVSLRELDFFLPLPFLQERQRQPVPANRVLLPWAIFS